MTLDEEKKILDAVFDVADHITTLHLTGGGEPFLHPYLAEFIDCAMKYSNQFDTLMLFTNCTIPVSQPLLKTLVKYKEKILVQVSQYGKKPEQEARILQSLLSHGIQCKVVKYFGEAQDFSGWVDFGSWESQDMTDDELENRFHTCAVTNIMHGNWRTRDGKVHWCSRSQRGMELGLIPEDSRDYVDLFANATREEKRKKFLRIASASCLSACRRCSGDQGTEALDHRYPAAEQLR